jgi:hypothetical protein
MRVTCPANLFHYVLHTERYVQQTSLYLLVTKPWQILFFKQNEQIFHALDRGMKYQFVRNSVPSSQEKKLRHHNHNQLVNAV